MDTNTWNAGREQTLNVINDIKNPLNYYSYNFSKLETSRIRNVTGSCRPPKLTKNKNLAPILIATMRHGDQKVLDWTPVQGRR